MYRILSGVLALAVLAALATPAAATHYPKYFERTYSYDVPPPPADPRYVSTRTFTVPASAIMICYERVYYDGYEASTLHVTIRDGAGRVVVDDHAATLAVPVDLAVSPGTPVAPMRAFVPGTWTITFEGMGDNGYSTIRLYEITNTAECGHYVH